MGELRSFLYRGHMRELVAEGDARELASAIFGEWRDLYYAAICTYIRLWDEARATKRTHFMHGPSREWCAAAALLLSVADNPTQDQFLRADENTKDRMVEAVQRDGGVEALNGYFVELA